MKKVGFGFGYVPGVIFPDPFKQGVTKRCRLSLLTNSALVYESKCGGMGGEVAGSQPMSTAVHITWQRVQINLEMYRYLCIQDSASPKSSGSDWVCIGNTMFLTKSFLPRTFGSAGAGVPAAVRVPVQQEPRPGAVHSTPVQLLHNSRHGYKPLLSLSFHDPGPPDPKTATKERGEKILLSYLFCNHKYKKNWKLSYFWTGEEKNVGHFTKNYRIFYPKIVIKFSKI